MKFECGDLERALASPELMPEAREHLRDCAVCRNEYRIWNEISSAARQLQCEWDSPDLWPRIRRDLEAQRQRPKRRRIEWTFGAIAAVAAAVVLLTIVRWPQIAALLTMDNKVESTTVSGRDFLTEQALRAVEKNETAYRRSIEELSRLAQPKLQSPVSSPILASYREKLLMLDSAILDTRSNVAQNRFNVGLQTELAGLYRDKQHTLQEVLTRGQRN
jgi:hypothetical protein